MPDLGEDNLKLLALGRKSILEQGEDEVRRSVEALGDDKIAVSGTAGDQDRDGKIEGKFGAAVDVGKGFKLGGEVEKSSTGWGWFLGGIWRKKKKP